MAKNIKVTIIKSLIINTVKNITFKKGLIDKGADPRITVPAYHEQAGDEEYHERLLQRGYYTNVELLKTRLGDYLDGTGDIADDPLISDYEQDGTNILILKVSDRFNDGYVKSLARLCSRFIEDSMIADWYAILDDKKSAYFNAIAEKDMASIQQTFTKTAPVAPRYKYPTAIHIRYPVITGIDDIPGYITPDNKETIQPELLYNNPFIIAIGQDTEISYTLEGENGEKPLDDIIVRCDNPSCCTPRIERNGEWSLHADKYGFAIVTLLSRHNDSVFVSFAIRVV